MRNFIAMDFSKQRTFLNICIIAPFIGGLISVWLGADVNWDLANYHLYNPFAFFNEKFTLDLAPAGLQTYFNPLLDIPYYWMSHHLPAVLVGFIMGFFHSINFILVALIARQLLNNLPSGDQYKIPILLALFGCLTANFSSAFGNTMGDIITAAFILTSLLIILNTLKLDPTLKSAVGIFSLAGFIAGLATGLKLTNAVFAVALCSSIFMLHTSSYTRLKLSFIFGISVLAGVSLTAGYWFYEMWIHFGNPLFPQFSKFFPNELTRDISVADVRWGPRSFTETIFWPIILSVNPLKAGELRHHQIIWAIFYILIIFLIFKLFFSRIKKQSFHSLSLSEKYILAFICIAFIVWLKLFSIQRYLVAIEIIIPLAVFLILTHTFSYGLARKYALRLLAASTLIVYLGGYKTWGHADWAKDMFRVELPPIIAPEKTTVIMAGGDPPFGWLVPGFPPDVAFAQVNGNFPSNIPVYSKRIDQIVEARKGDVFVLFQSEPDSERYKRVEKANTFLAFLKINKSNYGCGLLKKIIPILKLEKKVQVNVESTYPCQLVALHLDKSVGKIDAYYEEQAIQALAIYGFLMIPEECRTYQAFIGQKSYKYRWCPVNRVKGA